MRLALLEPRLAVLHTEIFKNFTKLWELSELGRSAQQLPQRNWLGIGILA